MRVIVCGFGESVEVGADGYVPLERALQVIRQPLIWKDSPKATAAIRDLYTPDDLWFTTRSSRTLARPKGYSVRSSCLARLSEECWRANYRNGPLYPVVLELFLPNVLILDARPGNPVDGMVFISVDVRSNELSIIAD